MSIDLYCCLSIYRSVAPSIYLAIYLAMCLLIDLSICLRTFPREWCKRARGWLSRQEAGARGALAGLLVSRLRAPMAWQSLGKRMRASSLLVSGTHSGRRCFTNRSFSVACSLAKPGQQGVTEKGKQNGGRANAKAGSRLRARDNPGHGFDDGTRSLLAAPLPSYRLQMAY